MASPGLSLVEGTARGHAGDQHEDVGTHLRKARPNTAGPRSTDDQSPRRVQPGASYDGVSDPPSTWDFANDDTGQYDALNGSALDSSALGSTLGAATARRTVAGLTSASHGGAMEDTS